METIIIFIVTCLLIYSLFYVSKEIWQGWQFNQRQKAIKQFEWKIKQMNDQIAQANEALNRDAYEAYQQLIKESMLAAKDSHQSKMNDSTSQTNSSKPRKEV